MNERKIIVNELLCYCVNARETMNRDSIEMVISGYFEINELTLAKEILTSDIYIKNILDKSECRFIVKRKAPNLANKISKDIIGIFDLIDELNPESMPLYVASNIRRIPPLGDQNTNMASIHSAIILLRNNVNLINEAITPLLISANEVNINKDNDIPNICEHISADISIDHSLPDAIVNNHETYASKVRKPTADDNFTLVNKNVKNVKNVNKVKTTRRNVITIGKGSSEAFGKPPARRYHLFLSRINIDVTIESIKSYICKEFEITSDECSVEKIITSRHFVSSFKVSLMIDNVQDMYNCNRWPSGILIKRFYNKINKTNIDNNINVNVNPTN